MDGYDRSIVDVIRTTIHDAQELVRAEIVLARTELRQEARRLGASIAIIAAAAVAALIAVIFLLTAVAWAIPLVLAWPAWTGFAIVGGVVLIVAIALAMVGRTRFNSGRHMPLTLDTMKETMQWTRARNS
jgi:hypothetical protein